MCKMVAPENKVAEKMSGKYHRLLKLKMGKYKGKVNDHECLEKGSAHYGSWSNLNHYLFL